MKSFIQPRISMGYGKLPIKIILSIFILSLFLRLLVIIIYPDMPVSTDIINDYDHIATNILAGNGFVRDIGDPDFSRGPGAPLFLSAIYLIFGKSYIAVRVIQSILDSITVLITMYLSWLLFKRWDRVYIVGIILAIYPIMIYSSNLVGVEALFCFSFMLTILIFVLAIRKDNAILFCISGIVLAFTTMVRSTPLLYPIIMGIWLGSWGGFTKKCIYYFILLCCGYIITLAPWTIRNYKVFHEFIPTVANGGYNFYRGAPVFSSGSLYERNQVEPPEDLQDQIGKSPNEFDAYLWHEGWRNYKNAWDNSPLDVLKFLLYKAARFWFATDSGRYQEIIFAMQIPFLILSILGLVSIGWNHNFPKELWLMALTIVYFWGIFIVMVPLARYTVPILPFLSIFVSGLVQRKIET